MCSVGVWPPWRYLPVYPLEMNFVFGCKWRLNNKFKVLTYLLVVFRLKTARPGTNINQGFTLAKEGWLLVGASWHRPRKITGGSRCTVR